MQHEGHTTTAKYLIILTMSPVVIQKSGPVCPSASSYFQAHVLVAWEYSDGCCSRCRGINISLKKQDLLLHGQRPQPVHYQINNLYRRDSSNTFVTMQPLSIQHESATLNDHYKIGADIFIQSTSSGCHNQFTDCRRNVFELQVQYNTQKTTKL
jgi:hypothetical protein